MLREFDPPSGLTWEEPAPPATSEARANLAPSEPSSYSMVPGHKALWGDVRHVLTLFSICVHTTMQERKSFVRPR